MVALDAGMIVRRLSDQGRAVRCRRLAQPILNDHRRQADQHQMPPAQAAPIFRYRMRRFLPWPAGVRFFQGPGDVMPQAPSETVYAS